MYKFLETINAVLINKTYLLLIIILCFYSSVKAQTINKFNFIGVNPSVTVEPFYERGEMDINILPVVYQRPFSRRADIRLTSILNLGIRNVANEISHLGLETAIPIFINPKEYKKQSSEGFYVAPVLSLTRNRLEENNNIGLWIEPGYNLLFDNRYAMTFGLQFGGTYFVYEDAQSSWRNHFGIKIILGRWF